MTNYIKNHMTNKAAEGFGSTANTSLSDFYRRYIASLNERNFDVLETLIADDVAVNGKMHKREDVVAGLHWLTTTVPDYVWKIEDLFTEEERIAVRLRDKGTPVETFLGAAPTGASIEFTEFASYRVQGGQFVEMWYLLDTASIIDQLSKQ